MRAIDGDALYDRIVVSEELARDRVIDTPNSFPNGSLNPSAIRYLAQLGERTQFKHMVCDAPTIEPEIVRCGQCKYAEVADAQDNQDGYTCQFHRGSIWFSGSYCSWGERRTDDSISD